MRKLLLTAFEPFGGESVNPSLEAARQITGVGFREAVVNVLELPVDRFRAIEMALEQIRSARPDFVMMLGEAGGRYRVMPERLAINVDDFRIPDNAGNQPAGEPIVEGGPVGYFSTLPVRAIVDRLIKARIPAAISNSAGTYLCNRLFYSVMHAVETERLQTVAGFIHVPYLHDQVIGKPVEQPSMARETIVEALRLAIEETVNAW
jgi:pyroglutamyl-peptidase